MGSKSAKPKKKDAKVLLEVYCMILKFLISSF